MSIRTLEALLAAFRDAGATQVLCKRLAENDNSKQQIYLGNSFESLNLLPFGAMEQSKGIARPNLKAPIQLGWMDMEGRIEPARGAQLILYPDYPEVRLSGFLRGCANAPAVLMRPIPRESRRFDNEPDGRLLFLALHPERRLIAHAVGAASPIAREFDDYIARNPPVRRGVFLDIPIGRRDTRSELLVRLREIHRAGWHESRRLDREGRALPYVARNGAGYTLEALLGITPNARALPDFLGWEVKACGRDRVTLMTPEPDSGYYGQHGVEAFVRRFGHDAGRDTLYFTGQHRTGVRCAATGQRLILRGFDAQSGRITNINGGIYLITDDDMDSAGWSFRRLLEHWGRKHAAAAYVPYESGTGLVPRYRYNSPASLGEGTEFARFLLALADGVIVFDPGSKVMNASRQAGKVKARSQFRISKKYLPRLYARFQDESLN
ncbi:MAG: hypothetical protein KIT37_12815 [Steroidobacteraceae bacterium]|nr:hypothetical protein [Steroidobacteraceae bacterium]